jgi:hypothetical protein
VSDTHGPREFFERASEPLNARDLERYLEFVHPDAEFAPLLTGMDETVYVGHEGVRRWLSSIWNTWAGYRVSVKAAHETSERVAIVEFILKLRAHGSEVELETQAFGVVERDETLELVTGWRFYETAAAAREAALEATTAR